MPKTKRSAEDQKDSRLDCYLSSSDNLDDDYPPPPLKPKSQWLTGKMKKEPAKEKAAVPSASRKKVDPPTDLVSEDDGGADAEKPALSDGNMVTIMSLLGMDYEKSVLAKKKKLDHFTDEVIEKHQAKVEKALKGQWEKRGSLLDDFRRNASEVMDQWEKDMQAVKDQEAKMRKQFDQHMKAIQQVIGQEAMRIAALRKIQTAFVKAQEELESKQKSETCSLNAELRKEMEKVHKKMTQENARQALANARNSLMMQDF